MMEESLQDVSVVRDDGVAGKVTAVTVNGNGSPIAVVKADDGAQVAVAPQMITPDENGIYRLEVAASRLASAEDLVIPVVAEEILVGTEQITSGVVRIHKHVVTEEKTVDTAVSAEEVVVERLPMNQFVEGDAPQIREENGTVIIPVLEEVLVVEKRLMLREEVHLSKRVTSSNAPKQSCCATKLSTSNVQKRTNLRPPLTLKGEHQMRTVIGLFDDRIEAMNAYSALEADGFSGSDLDILTNDDRCDEPKLERIRQYVPEPDSSIYLEGVRKGGTLLTARADGDRMQRAAQIMSGYDMVNVQDRSRDWRAANADLPEMTTTANNSNVLDVIEEDLQIGKETVERGRMRAYSVVTEKPVEENVPLREETIRVQRRPVDRTVPADPTLFQEKSIEVVERAEVPHVDKVARVVEEVVVGKDVNERVETVQDTVRRQDVKVEPVGTAADGMTSGMRDFSAYDNDFRAYYKSNWANSGMSYEQYSPGLRYGYDLANNDTYRNKRWSDIEPSARRDWEARNPGTAWDKIKAAVQHSWETVTGQR